MKSLFEDGEYVIHHFIARNQIVHSTAEPFKLPDGWNKVDGLYDHHIFSNPHLIFWVEGKTKLISQMLDP